jgi:outer membrane protein assembly factor BamB
MHSYGGRRLATLVSALCLMAVDHPAMAEEDRFDGPPILEWRVPIPGPRLSAATHTELGAPLLYEDYIFLGSAADDALLVLHREDGRLIRRIEAGAPVQSAPVIAGEHLFFSDGAGTTWCYPLEGGDAVWSHSSGAPILSSPRVESDKVIVANLADVVVALDRESGEMLWRHAQKLDPKRSNELLLYGAPQPVLFEGEVLAGFSDGTLAGLEVSTGALRWQRRVGEGTYPDLIAAPIRVGDQVILAAYSEPLVGMDPISRNIRWRLDVGGAHPAAAAEDGRRIYHGGVDGVLRSLAVESGSEFWTWDSETGASLTTPLITEAGLLVASSGGGLYLVDSETGDLLWSWDPGYRLSGFSASPVTEGRQAIAVSNAGFVMSFIVPD